MEAKESPSGVRIYDTHMHLDFIGNADEVARDAEEMGMTLFGCTVTPEDYLAQRGTLGALPNVRLGAGLHPWWIGDGSHGLDDAKELADLVGETRWVGEVGIDYSRNWGGPDARHALQRECFRTIASACACQGDRIVTIHATRSAADVLDILEDTSCIRRSAACILHWFSGSTDDMWRAIRAGMWFSVNEMQATTRKAKEQLKLVPRDRLLLESDLPPKRGEPFSARAIERSLRSAATLLARIRGMETQEVLELTAENSRRLLG